MDYFIHILILITIYIILSVSLDLIIGYTGLLSVSHAALFGIGAYVTALVALNTQASFMLSLFAAIIIGGIFGAILGISSVRIRGEHFVIATFAYQYFIYNILNNWTSLTGGPIGLPGIPEPRILGFSINSNYEYLIVAVSICLVMFLIASRIVHAPFGRVLKAIREDELLAQSIGKDVAVYKVLVFTVSASMAAIAGTMYAYYMKFIDPSSFTVLESIFIMSIVIIGGAGSLWGPFVGAVILVALPEILRFIGLPNIVAGNIRQILYGIFLVLFMIWRPRGIIGRYSFQMDKYPQ